MWTCTYCFTRNPLQYLKCQFLLHIFCNFCHFYADSYFVTYVILPSDVVFIQNWVKLHKPQKYLHHNTLHVFWFTIFDNHVTHLPSSMQFLPSDVSYIKTGLNYTNQNRCGYPSLQLRLFSSPHWNYSNSYMQFYIMVNENNATR